MRSDKFYHTHFGRRYYTWVVLLLLAAGGLAISSCTRGNKQSKSGGTIEASASYGLEKNSSKLTGRRCDCRTGSDWGWNYQQNQGRFGLESRLRDKVNTVLAENVPEDADVRRCDGAHG